MNKSFCLLPNKVEAFKKALKNKKINIADLLNMSSEQRIKLLEEYAGKNAADVNLLFEQKLVLKNKILGVKNWARKIGEIGRYDKTKKAEIEMMLEEFKKEQQERIFNPKAEENFYNALADEQLGTHITRSEANRIFELTIKAEEQLKKFDKKTGKWSSEQAKTKYGASKVILEKYINALKDENITLTDMIKSRILRAKREFKDNKAGAVQNLFSDAIKEISDASISLVASIDNSFLGRQGLNVLQTRPSIWYDAAKKSFVDIYNSIKNKKGAEMAKDAVIADVYSRENYINGNYDIAKLIPKAEEQFPTSLPGKIPGLGRVFNASEAAFTNSAVRMRTELFDVLSDIAKSNEVKMDKTQIKDLGKLINSVTARGDLGKLGQGGAIRLVLWAPKMLKANFDVLTAHRFGAGLETPFARRQAKINLLKIVSSTATVAAILNAIKPGTVEVDPTSSDFMKAKFGNTRFDLTGGKGSLITLLARGITMKSKSTLTGIKSDLNSGDYGAKSYFDVGIDFLSNKTTPFSKAIINYAKGKDFSGKKPTLASTAYQLTTPISVQNFVKNFYGDDKDGSVAAILGSILDLIGISANTYNVNEDWELKDSKEMIQFKEEVGEEDFKQANKEYNYLFEQQIRDIINTDRYKEMSEEEKKKKITSIKNYVKKQIFDKYSK